MRLAPAWHPLALASSQGGRKHPPEQHLLDTGSSEPGRHKLKDSLGAPRRDSLLQDVSHQGGPAPLAAGRTVGRASAAPLAGTLQGPGQAPGTAEASRKAMQA